MVPKILCTCWWVPIILERRLSVSARVAQPVATGGFTTLICNGPESSRSQPCGKRVWSAIDVHCLPFRATRHCPEAVEWSWLKTKWTRARAYVVGRYSRRKLTFSVIALINLQFERAICFWDLIIQKATYPKRDSNTDRHKRENK